MVQNLRHGRGIYRAADGSSYDGEWAKGLRSGQGVDISADGLTTYTGGWLGDKRHGYGKLKPPMRSVDLDEDYAGLRVSGVRAYGMAADGSSGLLATCMKAIGWATKGMAAARLNRPHWRLPMMESGLVTHDAVRGRSSA